MVGALCGYVQADLMIPAVVWADAAEANTAARAWCDEVNNRTHSTIAAVPANSMAEERLLFRPLPSLRPTLRAGERRRVDKLSTVRFGSALIVVGDMGYDGSDREAPRSAGQTARQPQTTTGVADCRAAVRTTLALSHLLDAAWTTPTGGDRAVRNRPSRLEFDLAGAGDHTELFHRLG
jgi:hypothetical protein